MAPRHCSSLSSNKQHVLVNRKRRKLRGEQDIIISSAIMLFPEHQAQPQAAGEAWMCHIHTPPEARPSHRATCAHRGKAQHTRSSTDHGPTARTPQLATTMHDRGWMSICWGSPWAEASDAVTAPYMLPGLCFLIHHLPCPFRLGTL